MDLLMFKLSSFAVSSALRFSSITCLLASVASAHVQLESPTGGEVYTVGQTVRVDWSVLIPHGQIGWDLSYSVTGNDGPWIDIAIGLPPGSTAGGSVHFYDWIVPDNVSDQVRVRIIQDNPGMTQDYLDRSNNDLSIISCSAPQTYCTTSPNSVGSGATIGWMGSPNVSTNTFELTAMGAPALKPAIFFYGGDQVASPFGNGVRCVGSLAGEGVFRLGPPIMTTPSGAASFSLDANAIAAPAPGSFETGDTYNFQLWYRDSTGAGAGFNLTDGLSVTFCP